MMTADQILKLARVTFSRPSSKPRVLVLLSNGDSITCSADHPWLASRFPAGCVREWVRADQLTRSPYVVRHLSPWEPERSFEAGWLSGMFDGSGSLSFGEGNAAKLCVVEGSGDILGLAAFRLRDFGFQPLPDGRSGGSAAIQTYTLSDTIRRWSHGTTIGTNAVLEHDGAVTGMITTEGYRDIVHIGRHQRPQHYSIRQEVPWQDRELARRRHRLTVAERLVPPKGDVLVPLRAP